MDRGGRVDFVVDKLLDDPRTITLALVAGDGAYDGESSVLGALTLRVRTQHAELLTCAVHRQQQRRGIGRLLVLWAVLLCYCDGLRALLVAAGSDVIAFWSALGFGPPSLGRQPAEIRAACAALSSEFEDSCVLLRPIERDRLGERDGPSPSFLQLEGQLEEAIKRLNASSNKRKRP